MDETSKITATVAAAAKAAGDGDYNAAERYLREVVALQEAAFGPVHPDLANTLNNLGVACEHAGRLDAAEDSYRRAYAIAQTAFAPGHPFVIRSAENLRDFCEARGRPFDLPAPAAATPHAAVAVPRSIPDVPASVAPAPAMPAAAPPLASSPSRAPVPPLPLAETPLIQLDSPPYRADAAPRRSRFLPILIAIGTAAVLVAWWLWPAIAPATTPAPEAMQAPTATPSPAAELDPFPAGPDAVRPEPEATPTAPDTPAPLPPVDSLDPVADVPQVASAAGPVAVVRADVCRKFLPRGSPWRCDVVEGSTTPGALVFLTRIRSPTPARIEHRWYRGDELIQSVDLRVGANAGEGYRTYSRNTVTAGQAGQWRVELRAGDALLHEQRFTVVAQ